jgi:hypothetical protein
MSPRRKPLVAEILHGHDDGSLLLVRAATLSALPEALEIAHAEAAGDDYVITYPDAVGLQWIRAIPCRWEGHEMEGWWCEGRQRCHYIESRAGRGAFSGAFVEITYADDLEDDDPRKARYLAECAAMEARRVPDLTGFDLYCRASGIEPGPEAMADYLREVHGWDGQMTEVTGQDSTDG